MGTIIWRFENFINTILDIVIIKTGLVISEDYLMQILQELYPEDFIFEDYQDKKNNVMRMRAEDFDQYCWGIRKKLGELDKEMSPILTNDFDQYMDWQEKGYNILGVYKRFFQLAEKEHIPIGEELFIDQKFINYLEANPEKLEFMHWRNFERLTAEFFSRQHYNVELGPGSNDGGVDLRIYDKKDIMKPYIIIQCKRHKKNNDVKIETVKSFYSDVEFEGAKKGLVATTSSIAPGGKKVVSIRKYPLEFAENKEIVDWVKKMTKR